MATDEAAEREAALRKRLWIAGGGIIGLVTVGVVACTVAYSSSSSADQCRDLVREAHGGDSRFVEVTFTDGDFVKGSVGQYAGGDETVYAYWECTVEAGEPEITFFQRAG
jgi:hypothetical protein